MLKLQKMMFMLYGLARLCKNSKALLSTTLLDGMYYELIYNGNKNEIYFDAYKKFENQCIQIGERM